eukprot:TRINITY_DN6473_c0_g1_i1.p1 TRINITY_DN6473_c0_g1~~TRINITY_DN6473_c0_g1_i1.p1  ORF type:complete len:467 (-),score=106.46 TRINITY_DN6473_c0_g1_i1:219-1619(-)
MYMIFGFLLRTVYNTFVLWYEHPFVCTFLGFIIYWIAKALNPEVIGIKSAPKKISENGRAPNDTKAQTLDDFEPQVVVIGAGASGLAIAACLKKENISFVVAEKAATVGGKWSDQIHFHSSREASRLPFVPFPGDLSVWPSKRDVTNYLMGYPIMLGMTEQILLNHNVKSVQYDVNSKRFLITAETAGKHRIFHPRQVVVAAGEDAVPAMPQIEGQENFRGKLFHSSQYNGGADLKGKNVLVVGFGNAACEIAADLWEHDAKVSILVRGPVNLTSRFTSYIYDIFVGVFGARRLPMWIHDKIFQLYMKVVYSDLIQRGVVTPHPSRGPISGIVGNHKAITVDFGAIDLIRKNEILVITQEIKRITADGVVLADEKELSFDAIIFATGYERAAVSAAFLDEDLLKSVLNEEQLIVGGQESPVQDLYFIGQNDFFGKFKEISLEANRIAKHISQKKEAVSTLVTKSQL